MGINEKTKAEEKNTKPEKTAFGQQEKEVSMLTSLSPDGIQPSNLPRLDILKSILERIEASSQIWPEEALRAALKRFERMKKKSNGRKCRRQEFAEESAKRKKSVTDYWEENTLSDLKLYTKVRDQLQKELESIRTKSVEEVSRTKKLYSETLDILVIEMINRALGEITFKNPINSWTELAHMFQAAQLAYEAIKSKPREKAKWTETILNKIDRINSSIEIITKARDSKQMPKEELSKGRRIMRELGLILDRRDDIIVAISKLTEKATVYQRKLDTHENRKAFSKMNKKYELHRSRFYRDLNGHEKYVNLI
ncbi:hypothetical protein ACJJTC_002040 [Scirpophaga incertulas]